jgi:RNA polymerase sigma factor (sigma-70 family)
MPVMAGPSGFEAFFDGEYEAVVRSLTLVFGDREQAEDSAQVAFERAFVRWSRVREMPRPGTWVYVVALRHGRRALARGVRAEGSVASRVSDEADAILDRMTLGEQIRALPAQQRAVVVLRLLVSLSTREVADVMGIREGTVKSTLHAALQRLRVATEDEEEVRIDGSA